MLIEPFYVIPDPFVRGPGLVNTSQLRVVAMFTAGHPQYLQYLHSIYTVSTQYLPLHSGLRGQGHSLSTSLHTYIKSFPQRLSSYPASSLEPNLRTQQ